MNETLHTPEPGTKKKERIISVGASLPTQRPDNSLSNKVKAELESIQSGNLILQVGGKYDSETIKFIQNALKERGFKDIKISGKYDTATEEIVRSFQNNKNNLIAGTNRTLVPDGVLGPRTFRALFGKNDGTGDPKLTSIGIKLLSLEEFEKTIKNDYQHGDGHWDYDKQDNVNTRRDIPREYWGSFGETLDSSGQIAAQENLIMSEFANMHLSIFQARNLRKFLFAVRVGEGTSGSKGYYQKVGGGTQLDPFITGSRALRINGRTVYSSAAGAYQITDSTAGFLRSRGVEVNVDPKTQDIAALKLLEIQGGRTAFMNVANGNFEASLNKISNIWASFPRYEGDSAGRYGQNAKQLGLLRNAYDNAKV